MNIEAIRDTIDILHGPPLPVISDCLRGFLIAKPGHELVGCDFSAIEARVLAWLAGEEKILEAFRGDGLVYERAASAIYGVALDAVTKAQRQIGKVAVLALGYQGGKVAFQTMAKNYGIKVSEEEADTIKKNWRKANARIEQYWFDVEEAAMKAVLTPKVIFAAGPKGKEVKYLTNGAFLLCRLPSTRVISYPYPKAEEVDTPWGEKKMAVTYMAVDAYTRKWDRHKGYGGLFVENITQAVARDLLAQAMLRAEARGYPVVLHVHDEFVLEVKAGRDLTSVIEALASEAPDWAGDMPIAAEAWQGKRYRK